jgi:hypothetical protein
MCDSLGTKSACETGVEESKSGSQVNCVWIRGAGNSYSCVMENSAFSCSYYQSQQNCGKNLAGNKCVWVESEVAEHHCHDVQDSCMKIIREATCLFEGTAISDLGTEKEKKITCIWVADEGEGTRCQEVQESCAKVSREAVCRQDGAVKGVDGIKLRCLWVVGNASSSNTPTSTCVSEVCGLFFPDMLLKLIHFILTGEYIM